MLDIITIKSGTMKTMAAVLFAFAAMGNPGAASGAIRETCTFVKQLEDPVESRNFRMQVNAAVQASTSRYGEFQADTPVTIVKDGETFEVDSFSYNCMSCHDGTTSPAHDISFKKAADSGMFSGSLTSHPIGTHYGSASYVNSELRRLEQLDPNMILIDGRVGCLTCHNPFNKKVPHLVVSNEGSNLCLTCHIK
ncbi:cytochrome c3 family protein [Geotalea sp. SG265]|uniref:cytochrome c3 family protein n=1 Tax=Geotalea sp. SG265 TaxID=2922867 RepID=UPI001FAFBF13|nr:cytochrome c3 family protein [Geotalea sp. SG265]